MIVKNTQRDIFEELHVSAVQSNKLFMAEIDITSICNCRCPFCFQGEEHQNHGEILTFEEIVRLLDELKELGCYYISFSGGEPFCRKDFVKILKEAKKRGFYITFVSNLQLASDEDIEEINTLGITKILVSFHSHDPETYANIFKVDSKMYWRALENIKHLISGGTPVGVSATISNQNATELHEIRDMFVNLGIPEKQIRFNPLLEGKNPVDKIRGENELCKYLCEHKDLRVNILSRLRTKRVSFCCSAGRTYCVIHPNGDVLPCGFVNKIAGNIRNDSLKHIWEESDVFKEIRNIQESDFPNCSTCEELETCPICIGNNLNETGKYTLPSEQYCRFRKNIGKALKV